MKTCLTESTKISRRSFLQALGALTLSGSLAACGGTGKAKSDRLAAGSLAYTPDEVVTVEFSDGGITVSPEDAAGLAVEETALSVSGAGVYALSGRCADGSVKVEVQTEDVVLLLDGLTLTSADTAPIVCGESTGVTIAVVDGTENTLTDSEANDPDNAADNENAEKAVVKCKDGSQVVLCGGGALTVNARGKNGIKSGTALDDRDASLTIRELTLNIEALVNDAINAEQRLKVESGNLTIAAGEDAIHCDMELNIGAEGTTGPAITVSTCGEGLEGAVLNIHSGNMDITSTDDCLNAANSDLGDYAFEMNISGGTIKAYSSGGEAFSIADESGKSVLDSTALCDAAFLFYSSPALTAEGRYSVQSTVTATAKTGEADTQFGGNGGPGGSGGQRPDGMTPPDGAPSDGQMPQGQPPQSDGTTPPELPAASSN